MNAPRPPPTMPRRRRRETEPSSLPSIAMSADPQQFAVRRVVGAAAGKVVERPARRGDEMPGDERRALVRALLAVLDAAFPFQHRPAVEPVLRELGEDAGEIYLSVAERAEPAGSV